MQVYIERGMVSKRYASNDGKRVYLTVLDTEGSEFDFIVPTGDGPSQAFARIGNLQLFELLARVKGRAGWIIGVLQNDDTWDTVSLQGRREPSVRKACPYSSWIEVSLRGIRQR